MKYNIIYINITTLIILIQYTLTSKLKHKDINTISNANGEPNPLLPIAAGIGGDVLLACSECKKMLYKFILNCVDQEANGKTATTFRGFCEAYRDQPHPSINTDICLIMNQKLSMVVAEPGNELENFYMKVKKNVKMNAIN